VFVQIFSILDRLMSLLASAGHSRATPSTAYLSDTFAVLTNLHREYLETYHTVHTALRESRWPLPRLLGRFQNQRAELMHLRTRLASLAQYLDTVATHNPKSVRGFVAAVIAYFQMAAGETRAGRHSSYVTLLDLFVMLERGIISRHEGAILAAAFPEEVRRRWSAVEAAYATLRPRTAPRSHAPNSPAKHSPDYSSVPSTSLDM
jgi:hypothetical protein